MFIYQCYFWYDDGYTWEKKKEIIVSNKKIYRKKIGENNLKPNR